MGDKLRVMPNVPSANTVETARLEARLRIVFEDECVEDGVAHAGEGVIGDALRSPRQDEILDCLRSLALDTQNPVFAASVLQCLARERQPGSADWRGGVIRDALRADSLEIRDAAILAAESWGGEEAIKVLRSHVEPVDWLRDYVEDVIEDLCA